MQTTEMNSSNLIKDFLPSNEKAGLVIIGGRLALANEMMFRGISKVRAPVRPLADEKKHQDILTKFKALTSQHIGVDFPEKNSVEIHQEENMLSKEVRFYVLDIEKYFKEKSEDFIADEIENITRYIKYGNQVILTLQSITGEERETFFKLIEKIVKKNKLIENLKNIVEMRCCNTFGVELKSNDREHYIIVENFY